MGKKSSSGVHDPYYYEALVGACRMLDLLSPDSQVKSVGLQYEGYEGGDDVVIRFESKRVELIQVKHSINESEVFSHADFLYQGAETNGKRPFSFLQKLIRAYREAKGEGLEPYPSLITNRIRANDPSNVKDPESGHQISLPVLADFLAWMKEEVKSRNIADFIVPDEYASAWKAWCRQFKELEGQDDQGAFIARLEIVTNHYNLSDLEGHLSNMLGRLLGGHDELTERTLNKSLSENTGAFVSNPCAGEVKQGEIV